MSEQDLAVRLEECLAHIEGTCPTCGRACMVPVEGIVREAAAELRRLTAEFRGAEDELKYQIRRAEQAEAERDKLAEICESIDAATPPAGETARERVAELVKALERYGDHEAGCIWFNSTADRCDCGLLAALRGEGRDA